MAIKPVQSYG
ncbi:hypothetical protein VTH06DRAFT_7281 [Thermothelomyces fergusii]